MLVVRKVNVMFDVNVKGDVRDILFIRITNIMLFNNMGVHLIFD